MRFLRPSTVVDDYYTGELKTALEKMSLSEMSFVMYYAPWDAESQRVRWHFEAAARYYHKEVRCAPVLTKIDSVEFCVTMFCFVTFLSYRFILLQLIVGNQGVSAAKQIKFTLSPC